VRRREFVLGAAGAACAWSVAAFAQTPRDRGRRVAVLRQANNSDPEEQRLVAAFVGQLEKLGWHDGDNLRLEILWARNAGELRQHAETLVAGSPDVIVVNAAAARAALDATRQKPIVFVNINDPIGLGLVDDLAHPGGNITGFYNYDFGMVGKWIETLKEIAPSVSHVALLGSPDVPSYDGWVRAAEEFTRPFGMEIAAPTVRVTEDFERAFAELAQAPGKGAVVLPDSLVSRQRDVIIRSARQFRVPTIYPHTAYAKAGGLLAYGIEVTDIYRRGAAYVDRILKGANPGDLPVQGPSKFELVINLATARELGLEVPQQLRLLADEMIK
jgi:putative ABC transport system substrate-binding protein